MREYFKDLLEYASKTTSGDRRNSRRTVLVSLDDLSLPPRFLRRNSTLSMSVSRDDVRHVAQLARLDFSEEKEAQMADELSQILDYVDKLDELDTSGVSPMSHVLDVTNVFRADKVKERIDRAQALELAPEADDEYFRVPKVIE